MLNLHEYQSKRVFARYGIPIPQGEVATTPVEARDAARHLGGKVVIKAQVLVGGRGKAGGIKLAANPDEAEAKADAILGMNIKGLTVNKVLVDEAADIQTEIYLGLVIDRAQRRVVMMGSSEGGVDIEEVARHHGYDRIPEAMPCEVLQQGRRPAGFLPAAGHPADAAGAGGVNKKAARGELPLPTGLSTTPSRRVTDGEYHVRKPGQAREGAAPEVGRASRPGPVLGGPGPQRILDVAQAAAAPPQRGPVDRGARRQRHDANRQHGAAREVVQE